MNRLFMNLEMSQVTRQCEEAAQKMVTQFTEAQLRANSLDELIEAVVAEKVPGTIVLDLEGHQIDNEVVRTPRGPILGTPPYGGQHPAESIKALLHIPWSGNRKAFTFRPYQSLQQQNPEADITDREVVLFVIAFPGTPGDVTQKHLLDQQQILQQWVERVNSDIAGVEALIRAQVRGQIAERQQIQRQRDAMIDEFTIPIRQVAVDRALEIPVRRNTVVLRGSAPSSANGEPEWPWPTACTSRLSGRSPASPEPWSAARPVVPGCSSTRKRCATSSCSCSGATTKPLTA